MSARLRLLTRRVPRCPEPLALYRALCGQAGAPDSLLLESADSATGAARSLVIPRASLRLTGRGREVRVDALDELGAALLPDFGRGLEECEVEFSEGARGEAPEQGRDGVPDRAGSSLLLRFEEPPRALELSERLAQPTPLDGLRRAVHGFAPESGEDARHLICAGVFAYDALDLFEELPAPARDELGHPDFRFWLARELIIVDHASHRCSVVVAALDGVSEERAARSASRSRASLQRLVLACEQVPIAPSMGVAQKPVPPRGETPAEVRVTLDDAGYEQVVTRMQEHVRRGDVFQVVPSRGFMAPCAHPLAAYEVLRALEPSPYMFYVQAPDSVLFGASPETAVKVEPLPAGELRVSLKPIAGTRHRGRAPSGTLDADLDARQEASLRLDAKELSEHMMLVDLARNDVARVCRAGSRRVDPLLSVERYAHVMHLVSRVSGVLRPGLDALHAYQATANMGTLTGAPKLRAAQLLREHEATKRGPYGGAVGYLDGAGAMDTAIIIRSALVRDGVALVQAGAGVVADSVPAKEAAVTRAKAHVVLHAVSRAQSATAREGAPC